MKEFSFFSVKNVVKFFFQAEVIKKFSFACFSYKHLYNKLRASHLTTALPNNSSVAKRRILILWKIKTISNKYLKFKYAVAAEFTDSEDKEAVK